MKRPVDGALRGVRGVMAGKSSTEILPIVIHSSFDSLKLCCNNRINLTPIESAEFQDPLPEGVEYLQIPLVKDAAVGITHETGSDPMTIIRNLHTHASWPARN